MLPDVEIKSSKNIILVDFILTMRQLLSFIKKNRKEKKGTPAGVP